MEDETQRFDPQDIMATKGLSCLSYIGILFLIPMLVNQHSPYTKFHVNQGMVLFIILLIVSIASSILDWIPIIGWLLSSAMWVGFAVLAILGIVNSVQGRAKRLPIIGNIEIYH